MARAALDVEELVEQQLPRPVRRRWQRLDSAVSGFMEAQGIRLLRLALAVVFLWFGALKLAGRSPVADLVAETAYFVPAKVFVRVLGLWEMAIGFGLLFRFALRFTLLLFWTQMAGTFLVLVFRPRRAFQSSNPLLLTETGEFVIKNLVLIAAGLVVGSTVRRRREQPAG